ncbi:MAG: hemolysin III [Colwellia sp.]|jgi:hemolysin III
MTEKKDLSSANSQSNSYSHNEERLNAISHTFGLILSCFALFLLLKSSHGDPSRIVSFSVFGTSGILLFLASTIYHSLTNNRAKQLFKLLDHCAIYLLIAGTYTPLLAITLAGSLGYTLLAFIWLFAVAGILFKIKFGNKYKKISLGTYLGMGFISLSIFGELYEKLPKQAMGLLVLGGLIYSLGVFFYVKKTVPYTHAIWHLFVLGGATCHFLMIYWYV